MKLLRFYRSIYHDNAIRLQNRRSLRRDLWLYAKNSALRPLERRLVHDYRNDRLPIGFIVGTPRSGTTLLFQLIATHLRVGYPTNFVARYWMAPVYGSQRYRRQHGHTLRDIALRSQFGGTQGPHSPHEFSWFWQYWTDFGPTDDLSESELDAIDWPSIRGELAALAGFSGSPYVFKSLNHTVYNIARFARELPQSRFIYIQRDPRFVLQSILECRVERYGDERMWWTIRPRDVASWLTRDPVEQVSHQINDIRRGIERGLASLPEQRKLTITYEDMIADPRGVLLRVSELLMDAPFRDDSQLSRLSLTNGNLQRVDAARFERFEQELARCV